jgi:PEGA domain
VKSTRLLIVCCAFAGAVALLPADAAAQRGGGGAQPRGGGGTAPRGGGGGGQPRSSQAVPRTHPPVVNGGGGYGHGGYYRPYYGGYYRPFYAGYYPPYYGYWPYYAPYYGFYGGIGFGVGFGLGLYSGYYPYYAGYPYYGQYPYPPYPYYNYSGNWSSARLEMKPRDAQVYVDGYLVGRVDEFDGVFQRLDLPTGEHEIEVHMPGHRLYRQKTLFRPGESYHFKGVLEPLPPGAPEEPPPQPAARPEPDPNQPRDPRDPYIRDPYPRQPVGDPNRQGPPPGDAGRTMPMPERPGDRRGPESNSFGTLTMRVQPGDAVVVIDGERWDSPEGGSRLIVQLAGGSHRVEVRKDGFKPYSATIQIRPGESQSLNISLPPGLN